MERSSARDGWTRPSDGMWPMRSPEPRQASLCSAEKLTVDFPWTERSTWWIKCSVHLADTPRFPLEDLPQLQANMACAGVRKTIYFRWNRFLCCAWLVEFDERYWTQFLLPEIQLRFSSPEAGVDDRKERRARFLNESRYSGPPRKLLFFARRQGFMWYDQHYKALSSCRKRKCTQQEQRDVDTRKRRHSHVADVGSPFSSIKEITIHGGGESKVLVVSKYFSNTHE